MEVDHLGVFVFQRAVTVRMAVRLRPFPALVVVLLVLVVDMQVLMFHGRVQMVQLARIVRRPQGQRHECRCQCHGGKYREGRRQTQRDTESSSQRAGDQPAQVRQRKLRRVDGRPAAVVGGAPKQTVGRRLDKR